MSNAAAAQVPLVTADELLRIPDDGLRRELVRGEVREMTPAGRPHGKVALRIGARLETYVSAHGLGEAYAAETGFRLASNPDTVLAPDVSFVRSERLPELQAEGLISGPPDLAVEVVSPRDSFGDVQAKVFEWLAAGCRMVVVVDPRRRASTVYRSRSDVVLLTENDVLDGDDVVPGWTLPLRELFL
ncbi:MAG TPA: Uma2 family endonuclease [Longimicrobium sp.]|nr:Uma2 family endonuclease [Longimicrobium sp.]